MDPGWDVLITTYQLAQGAELDRKFLSKSVKWEVCLSSLFIAFTPTLFLLFPTRCLFARWEILIYFCLDMCIRRRPRLEELPEPAISAINEDPGAMAVVVDGYAVAE